MDSSFPYKTDYIMESDTDDNSDLPDVVIAKHVSSIIGKPIVRSVESLLGRNGTKIGILNATAFCEADAVPSIHEYYKAINIAGVTLFTMGALAVIFIFLLYVDTLKHIMRNAPPLVKTHSAFALSVYPVVALSTYCAIIVPRAQLLAEAMTSGAFMASLYQLFCLLVAYCGGEAELIRRVKPNSLNLKVGPCCCWPCCCLPFLTVDKKHVRYLRLLVLQLPVVQGLVYMVLMVMWAEEESLYQVNYMYLQPVVVVSILFGIWGITMTIKMLAEVLKDHHMQGKFLVLQMVLLLAKTQSLIFRIIVWCDLLPCRPPITPTVYGNLIYNSVMLSEMVILGIIARQLYRKDLPNLDSLEMSSVQPQQVCVIPTNVNKFSTEEKKLNC